MNAIAFVFPGQGSQSVGMGKDLYEKYEEVKKIYQEADEIMKMNLSSISFEGTFELLKETHITQPALFVHSYALLQLLPDKLKATCAAGHSLGEYTANVYANSFSFEEGLKLVKTRSQLMKNSGEIHKGTMAALIGLNEKQVTEICEKVAQNEVVQPANFNCPGQIVISGDVSAIERGIIIAKEEPYNCRIAKKLEVSGAFHSELMRTSDDELRVALDKVDFKDAEIPIYTNVEGLPITDKNQIKNALYRQLISSVKWEASIRNMIADGVKKFYEIGSGRVLTGLIKKIDKEVEIHNISNSDEVEKLLLNT
jgi:[acyl-carrier-protein] S-malonyltransferase